MRLSLKTLSLGLALLSFQVPGVASTPSHASCPQSQEPVVRARYLMGTVFELRLWLPPDHASRLAENVFSEVSSIERAVSTWREDSELSLIHRTPGPHGVSETLAGLIRAALTFHDATRGLYHPALGTLVAAFDLRGEGRWPSNDDLPIAMAHTRTATISFNRDERKLTLRDPEVRLDLDGIAKGWALDRAADLLRRSGVETALLNFGGQVLAMGPSAGCPAFPIQIATPDSKEAPIYELLLRNGSVSTTSNASRSRSVSGKAMGHILDPRTGGFAPFEGSVTVRAKTGAAADALSTALFVCGPERPQACVSAGVLRDEEVEAVFLVPDGKGSYSPRKAGVHAPDPSARATPGPGN